MTLNKLKEVYKNSPKSYIITYLILKILVIVCMIREIILLNYHNAILCIVTIILFDIPIYIKNKLKITVPNGLQIIILLFIFASEILGEIENFFCNYAYWDTILHTINGFLAASIGFSLADLLNTKNKITYSSLFISLYALCFSMTIGVLWEFFEYEVDNVKNVDMQKDTIINKLSSVELNQYKNNNPIKISNIDYTIVYDKEGNEIIINNGYLDIGLIDTMEDLYANLFGALAFSIYCYLYLNNSDKYPLIDKIRIKKSKLPN